jgi:hypothetical protein
MRRLKFVTLGVTLALGFVLEVLFHLVLAFFGSKAWLTEAFYWFHYPAVFLMFGWLDSDQGVPWQTALYVLIYSSIAVLQWCLLILAAIWTVQYFKSESII